MTDRGSLRHRRLTHLGSVRRNFEGRAILGLSLAELAGAAGVSVSAVLRAERGEHRRDPAQTQASALRALRAAFEARGIHFLEADAGAFGLSLDGRAVQPPVKRL